VREYASSLKVTVIGGCRHDRLRSHPKRVGCPNVRVPPFPDFNTPGGKILLGTVPGTANGIRERVTDIRTGFHETVIYAD